MTTTSENVIEIINYKGNLYIFKKDEDKEPIKIFRDRIWWVVRNMNKSLDFDTLVALSFIWANIKHNNVTYDDKIMKMLNDL